MRKAAHFFTRGFITIALLLAAGFFAIAQADEPNTIIAFSSEYPAIENAAFQQEFLSLLQKHTPLQERFTDVTDQMLNPSLGPYCYLPRTRRAYFKLGEIMTMTKEGSLEFARELREECRIRIFFGRQAEKTVWIAVYDTSGHPTQAISGAPYRFDGDGAWLSIIPIRRTESSPNFNDLANIAVRKEFERSP